MSRFRHFIVADDDYAVRSVIRRAIFRSYTTTTVSAVENGQDAIAAYEHVGADLVITDVDMPTMDGMTLVRRLREHGETTPIVVLSSNPDAQLKALAAGATCFLKKPFAIKELLGVLGDLVPVG